MGQVVPAAASATRPPRETVSVEIAAAGSA